MASRIITKKGSGAPLASDLVHGELAVDTVNKRLYTENAGGTIIELGTAPSTIDINSGTIDGTVIGGSSAAAGTFTSITGTSANINGTVTADGLNIGTPNDLNSAQVSVAAADNAFIEVESKTTQLTAGFMWTNSGTRKWTLEKTGTNHDLFLQNSADTTSVQFHQNNDISFYEDTGTTAKFFWDASAESLGIGTASPSYTLSLRNDSAISYPLSLESSTLGTIGNTVGMLFGYSGNTYKKGAIIFESLDANARGKMHFALDDSAGSGNVQLSDAKMTIDYSGNVGIGTTSPATPLHVKTNTTTNVGFFDYVGAATICGITDIGGSAELRVAGQVVSFTGAGGAGTEHMRIDSSGNLLVGATTTPSGITPGTRLGGGVNSNISAFAATTLVNHWLFYNGNGLVGSISTSGTTTTYNITSDQRLKDNIVDAPSSSDDIDAIQVRSFDWKADGSHQKYGMIAQELMTVAPEAVSGDPDSDEMMGVDYSKLVPMLIKEIQSLRARVAQLETN